MMTFQEYNQFKLILESEEIEQKYNSYSYNRGKVIFLSALINFLLITKEYNQIEKFLDEWDIKLPTKDDILPFTYLQNSKMLSKRETEKMISIQIKKNCYFYHITKPENIKSILNQGILTLNNILGNNIYKDSMLVNKTWENIYKKNVGKLSNKELIRIPFHNNLYKSRYHSVYLTTDLYEGFKWYGQGSEMFLRFVRNLCRNLDIEKQNIFYEKEDLRFIIEEQMRTLINITEEEKNEILNFFDQYYEKILNEEEQKEKSFVLVPYVNPTNNTVKKSVKLYGANQFLRMNDIEIYGNISNQGLIALTIREDENKKSTIKVLQKTYTE